MALLVLLSAPARARLVAADLRLVAPHRLGRRVVTADPGRLLRARRPERAGLRRLSAPASEDRRRFSGRIVEDQRRRPAWRGSARRLHGRGLVVQDRAQPPEVADDLLVDAILHRLEELEALLLVLDERIPLAVAAQADAFLEVVEAVEMVLPLGVDDLEHDVALDTLQDVA